MAGIRIGGVAAISLISPPFTAYEGSALSGDPQVYRWRSSDAPGVATAYTNFSGFTQADQCHNPVLSPDGTQILFEVLDATSGYREVWVTDNVPGSTPTQLVADGSNYVIHPFWGADSDTFVYVHCAGGTLAGGTIYKDQVSAIGSPVSLKAAAGGRSPFRPKFNFDGTRVAYIFDEDAANVAQLRVMDDDGTNDALLDGGLYGNRLDNPAMFSWANTMNVIAYEDGAPGSNLVHVINDDGTGKVQINAVGDAAGAAAVISSYAWPADDAYVIFGAHIGTPWSPVRAELDGSDTTQLGTIGGVNQNYFKSPIVYENRIWFISATDASSAGAKGAVSSMSLNGANEIERFDSSDGTGDQVAPFVGGDGWYFN